MRSSLPFSYRLWAPFPFPRIRAVEGRPRFHNDDDDDDDADDGGGNDDDDDADDADYDDDDNVQDAADNDYNDFGKESVRKVYTRRDSSGTHI